MSENCRVTNGKEAVALLLGSVKVKQVRKGVCVWVCGCVCVWVWVWVGGRVCVEVEITGGHRPVSVQIVKATEQMLAGLDKMSASLYFSNICECGAWRHGHSKHVHPVAARVTG